MTPEKYKEILSEFDALLSHARALGDRLTDRAFVGRHLAYVDTIYRS
jgi:hypothetical protein